MNFNRNNLDRAVSPYLRQHADNPIWWQEWNEATLKYAKENNKLIFVSIGYATCHWCHVMAGEAFSDDACACVLNDNFVSIKVDREQRPDIDQYFMDFILKRQGQGGWPLNVVLSPEGNPFFAATYLPLEEKFGMPDFKTSMEGVLDWYSSHKNGVRPHIPMKIESAKANIKLGEIAEFLKNSYDMECCGWGRSMKFPPSSTLLFLLNCHDVEKNWALEKETMMLMDTMSRRGLHDHLQGGFFRYCVDREWTIPHFEKMLYDQAMLLWTYASGYKVFEKDLYREVAARLVKCLEETFEEDGLFYSAHDADTVHEEGKTYVWTLEEIREILSEKEFEEFERVYELSGNFEGKIHLIKKSDKFLPDIEEKLLKERRKRAQPFTDKKFVTSWNALTGIAFAAAARFCGFETKTKAEKIYRELLEKHYKKSLSHSSLDGKLQEQGFLEDYAALLLLTTYIHEETLGEEDVIRKLLTELEKFKKDGVWFVNTSSKDFHFLAADDHDHPVPSGVSLAEMATLRAKILLGIREPEKFEYKVPYESDFYNLFVLMNEGYLYEVHTPQLLDWQKIPVNAIQVRGDNLQICYAGQCKLFD